MADFRISSVESSGFGVRSLAQVLKLHSEKRGQFVKFLV